MNDSLGGSNRLKDQPGNEYHNTPGGCLFTIFVLLIILLIIVVGWKLIIFLFLS